MHQNIFSLKQKLTGSLLDLFDSFALCISKEDYDGALELILRTQGKGKIFIWKESMASELQQLLNFLFDSEKQPLVSNSKFGDLYNLYGLTLRDQGKLQEAVQYLQNAIYKYEETNDHSILTEALCDLSSTLRVLGKTQDAEDFARTALERSESIPDIAEKQYWKGISLRILGNLETTNGNFVEAEDHLLEALDIWQEYSKTNDSQSEGMVNAFLALLYLEREDLPRDESLYKAEEFAKIALELAEGEKFPRDMARATLIHGLILFALGKSKEADAKVKAALEIATTNRLTEYKAEALLALIKTALYLENEELTHEYSKKLSSDESLLQYKSIQDEAASIIQ